MLIVQACVASWLPKGGALRIGCLAELLAHSSRPSNGNSSISWTVMLVRWRLHCLRWRLHR
eukprot:5117124-Prymnesium_polylepis.3